MKATPLPLLTHLRPTNTASSAGGWGVQVLGMFRLSSSILLQNIVAKLNHPGHFPAAAVAPEGTFVVAGGIRGVRKSAMGDHSLGRAVARWFRTTRAGTLIDAFAVLPRFPTCRPGTLFRKAGPGEQRPEITRGPNRPGGPANRQIDALTVFDLTTGDRLIDPS